MKKSVFLLLVVGMLPFSTGQEKVGREPGQSKTEKTIIGLENEWMNAVVKKDAKILDRIMADDFALLGERWAGDRELTTKENYIKNMTSIEAKSFSFDKIIVQVRDSVAVLHCLFTFEATSNGKPWGGTVRLTDTWIKERGQWRVLARHSSRPPQQPQ